MSYRLLPEIQRAERTRWSPERGGRIWQTVGGNKVKKFSYSPYTAKAYKRYTFYADVVFEKEIESPPSSGKKQNYSTIIANVGTFLEFREEVLSGRCIERLQSIIESIGGGDILGVGYWRNKGEKEADEE